MADKPSAGPRSARLPSWVYLAPATLIAIVLTFDVILRASTVNRELEVVVLAGLALAPVVKTFKADGKGIEFTTTLEADLSAALNEQDQRIVQLEECCKRFKGVGMPSSPSPVAALTIDPASLPLGVPLDDDQARQVIRALLDNRAYRMRSLRVLARETGRTPEDVRALCRAMSDVQEFYGKDGTAFFGLRKFQP